MIRSLLLSLLVFSPDAAAQCPAAGTVYFDGHEYPVVSIGMQCWFAENLGSTHFADGAGLLVVAESAQWQELSGSDIPMTSVVTRKGTPVGEGRVYNAAAVRSGKLCPVGWHVPSDEDWQRLECALGLSAMDAQQSGFRGVHADQLRGNHDRYEEWSGLDSFGFGALPGGFMDASGDCWNWSDSGFWWSSTEWKGGGELWMRSLSNWPTGMYRSIHPYGSGLSVRCLKD